MSRSELRWALITYVAAASLSNFLLAVGNLGPIHQRTAPTYCCGTEVDALHRSFEPDADDMWR